MINKILSLITVCIGMAWLSSCGSSARVDDMSNIGAFHKYSSSKVVEGIKVSFMVVNYPEPYIW